MKKPIIGITLDYENSGGYSKFPWYAIRNNYLHSLDSLNAIPFPLMHSQENIEELYDILDGLIITGGNFDINPMIYGEKDKGLRATKNRRTNFEISICKRFLNSEKPLMGICGGQQLINVVCGGTLIQDIKNHNEKSLEHEQINPRNETSHKVKILQKTKLKKIIKKNYIDVNSAHHQSVDKIGKNLIISSIASDGIIESIEHTVHKWCIGVQWQPEFLITKEDKELINNFIVTANQK